MRFICSILRGREDDRKWKKHLVLLSPLKILQGCRIQISCHTYRFLEFICAWVWYLSLNVRWVLTFRPWIITRLLITWSALDLLHVHTQCLLICMKFGMSCVSKHKLHTLYLEVMSLAICQIPPKFKKKGLLKHKFQKFWLFNCHFKNRPQVWKKWAERNLLSINNKLLGSLLDK